MTFGGILIIWWKSELMLEGPFNIRVFYAILLLLLLIINIQSDIINRKYISKKTGRKMKKKVRSISLILNLTEIFEKIVNSPLKRKNYTNYVQENFFFFEETVFDSNEKCTDLYHFGTTFYLCTWPLRKNVDSSLKYCCELSRTPKSSRFGSFFLCCRTICILNMWDLCFFNSPLNCEQAHK